MAFAQFSTDRIVLIDVSVAISFAFTDIFWRCLSSSTSRNCYCTPREMSKLSLKDIVKGSTRFRPTAAISLGAIAGASSRYYLGIGITDILGNQFPYSTLIVNITGCLTIGFLATILLSKSLRSYSDLRLLLVTGFLGSYTTFSSYELESITLLKKQSFGVFGVYWAGSFLLGFVALKGGIFIARTSLKLWVRER